MTTAQLNKQIGAIVEQKILEFLGDPDEGLQLKKSFLLKLRKRMSGKQKYVSHTEVTKKYGLR